MAAASAQTRAAVTGDAHATDRIADRSQTDAQAGLARQVEEVLRQALRPRMRYPGLARRRGWEGRVKLGLRVEEDGRLRDIRVVETSGHPILDRAAVRDLGSVGAVPVVSAWLGGRGLDLVLAVEYRLEDG